MKSIYINSQGGLGFNLALAHVIPELKQEYDEVAVLSPYFDVFEAKPEVDLVYKPQDLRDFIFEAKAKKARLICERMYDSQEFIYKEISYADAWRKAAGLPLKDNKEGSDTKSEFNVLEKYPLIEKQVEEIKSKIKDNGYKDYVIMQFSGGQSPLVRVPISERTKDDGTKEQFQDWSKVPYNYEQEPLRRHYPVDLAKKYVELFQKAHPETAIILYSLPNEPYQFEKTFKFTVPYLAYYELAKEAVGIVAIDSSLQHLVAGVTKSLVIWAHSAAKSFGYEYNKNIQQECRQDDILYFSALGPSGAAVKYIKPEDLLIETDSYLFGKAKDE